MHKLAFAFAAAAAVSIAAPAQATTVLSENFESGFGVFTPSGQVAIADGNDYVGCCSTHGSDMANHFVSFGSGDQPSGSIITSAFNTDLGVIYTLSFDYGALGAGSENLYFSLPDFFVTWTLTPLANNDLDTTFQNFTLDITGTGSPITLEFHSAGDDSVDAILDNVLITAPGVPEPATWAMMLLGFGAIGMAARRRRPARLRTT